MSHVTLDAFMKSYKQRLEEDMRLAVSQLNAPSIIKEAMDYSLQAGGKRIRPILLFATIQAFQRDPVIGMPIAAALEMIHTYSLIHDDLPSMDNDDFRRGKPTNHKVFGEAFAILAGDALLTFGFQRIAEATDLDAEQKVRLIAFLAKHAGPEGMVGGQTADIQGENKQLTFEEMEYIHLHKTGKLLTFAVLAGAIICEASKQQFQLFETFATHLGLAFQIRDDILDIEGDQMKLGKPVGSDTGNQKSTYPALLTLDGAKKHLNRHLQAAKQSLQKTELNTELLMELTDLIGARDH